MSYHVLIDQFNQVFIYVFSLGKTQLVEQSLFFCILLVYLGPVFA